MFRTLTPTLSVSPQIRVEQMPAIRAGGFVTVINNRPDDEEPGQPGGAAIRTAAEEAGLDYHAIPVGHGGFSTEQVEAMAAALRAAAGPVLAFCRSGTRSCFLWALAEASSGTDPETLSARAAAAGYDVSAIRPLLDQLAAR